MDVSHVSLRSRSHFGQQVGPRLTHSQELQRSITYRMVSEEVEITQNGEPHAWETMPDGHVLTRNIHPNAKLTVRFKNAGNIR